MWMYEIEAIVVADGERAVKTYMFSSLKSARLFISHAKKELDMQAYKMRESDTGRLLENWFIW